MQVRVCVRDEDVSRCFNVSAFLCLCQLNQPFFGPLTSKQSTLRKPLQATHAADGACNEYKDSRLPRPILDGRQALYLDARTDASIHHPIFVQTRPYSGQSVRQSTPGCALYAPGCTNGWLGDGDAAALDDKFADSSGG
mmetsp:Transcript_27167/g.67769  ORF Transcript_27167/g.67769 Transcript_27167/m.67769 type:complete len:139 (-) Transcript_27167:2423-2839(-)